MWLKLDDSSEDDEIFLLYFRKQIYRCCEIYLSERRAKLKKTPIKSIQQDVACKKIKEADDAQKREKTLEELKIDRLILINQRFENRKIRIKVSNWATKSA
ncbi:hypothetical protein ACKWTF_002412 [Chironomus riparius]